MQRIEFPSRKSKKRTDDLKKSINNLKLAFKFSHAGTFNDCATPTVTFGLIFGITPILPTKIGLIRCFVTNKYLNSIPLLYVILFTAVIAFGQRDARRLAQTYKRYDSLSNVTSKIAFFMTTITTYILFYNSYKNGTKLLETIRNVGEVDIVLKRMGQHFQYKIDTVYQYVVLLSFQLMQFILFGIQIWYNPNEQMRPVTFKIAIMDMLPLVLQNLMESQFVLLVMSIYQRLDRVNQQLFKTDFHVKTENGRTRLKKLHALMELHDELCDASSLINLAYGGQMFASTLTQFALIVTKLFTFYINYSRAPINSLISLGWAVLRTLELLRKVAACHVTGNQADYTKIVVHKLLMNECDDNVVAKLMEFSQQLMHRKVMFTASGMFSLDATLLFTVVSTVTNYIVILYQFNEASQPPTCYIPAKNQTN